MTSPTSGVSALAPDGVPEIGIGDDLAALLVPLVELADGDIVVVTSKVVSKAEGRVVEGSREELLLGETLRVVARRGPMTIVRNRLGLTMAAAGIDESNVEPGRSVLLPVDPDGSASALRGALAERTGRNVGVIVTDTAGRAWREGQTDIAIGAAGVTVLESYAGRVDTYGNALAVTAPAVADQIAGLAELAAGKLTGRPFVVVRGRADLVLAAGEHGPGARSLIRADDSDLFGYGSREAVIRAVAGRAVDRRPFGAPAPADELVAAIAGATGLLATEMAPDLVTCEGHRLDAVATLAFAHGWALETGEGPGDLRLRPITT